MARIQTHQSKRYINQTVHVKKSSSSIEKIQAVKEHQLGITNQESCEIFVVPNKKFCCIYLSVLIMLSLQTIEEHLQ